MRHITAEQLDKLDDLLAGLREVDGLKEKKRGVFYKKSRAFLHFHEDPAGLFADVRLGGEIFERFDVSSKKQQRGLLTRIRKVV